MTGQLQDKVAIVTGASNGIGRAIAETFAAEGAKTVLVARRAKLLDEVAAGIEAKGGTALPVPADLTSEEQIAALFDSAVKAYGRLDVLVNNAGISTPKNTEDITLQYWQRRARHQHHRTVPVQPRGDPHHEGANAAGRAHHQHRQHLAEDAAAGLAAATRCASTASRA